MFEQQKGGNMVISMCFRAVIHPVLTESLLFGLLCVRVSLYYDWFGTQGGTPTKHVAILGLRLLLLLLLLF